MNKIEPGEGYRLLGPDEIIQEGDEYINGDHWRKTINRAEDEMRPHTLIYRRKLPPPASTWISVNDRLPEVGARVWVHGEHGNVWLCDGASPDLAPWANGIIKHWQPATIPTPPSPEPSDAEKAWKMFLQVSEPGREFAESYREAWLNGWVFRNSYKEDK
jgi:hypothetical protein